MIFVFIKQKTAYELRISDWGSDVCSSDLPVFGALPPTRIRSVGHDPLRDDTIALGGRLKREVRGSEHRHLPDQMHGFLTLGGVIAPARGELDHAARFLRQAMGLGPLLEREGESA